ncbi:MAG: restriction endonuclease subunit S, partial [Paludibacteraceae bacterium]
PMQRNYKTPSNSSDMESEIAYVPLGELIVEYNKTNTEGKKLPVYGINKDNEFMPTVANLENVDTSKYKLLSKGIFAFNGMHVGRDIAVPIGKFDKDFDALISPAYTTFTIKENSEVLVEYIEIIIRRDEFDRLAWFYCDSSVRGGLDWKRLLNIPIPLPSIEEQEKVVSVWQGLRDIQQQNAALAKPLLQLCQSYIQECKHKYTIVQLGEYIEECNERNGDKQYNEDSVRGLTTAKQIIKTKANLDGVSLTSYKVMHPYDFAFVPDTSRRGDKVSLGFNETDKSYIVSSISEVFHVKNTNSLLPEYLFLIFNRSEFDRYARFNSWGSARETFNYSDYENIPIPLPPIEVQQAIVNLYRCAQECQALAKEAAEQAKTICPALIQQVIHKTK